MPVDLYYIGGSAPCRSVLITAKAVGVDLNLKETNLMKGEHMTPEFLKMNPQHVVPTMDDNGLVLWESRAILAYLAEKYGKNGSLYPTDPAKRALVNQRLFFDMGTLYQRFGDYAYPMMFGGAPKDEEKLKKLDEALGFLNTFLEGSKFSAGENITIADHSLLASVSTIEACEVTDLTKFPNVSRWLADCKSTVDSYQEVNGGGAEYFGNWFKSTVNK